jgi:hypothetical protein
MTIGFGFAEPIRDNTWILTASTKFSSAREKLRLASGAFLVIIQKGVTEHDMRTGSLQIC